MSAADLMFDLARSGIRIEAHGDRLRYSPRSAVTPDLAERMKTHKSELLAILRGGRTTILCPWCRRTTLFDGRRGVWCTDCERLAWLYEPHGAVIRADHANHEVIDPPDPCPECGTLELWQTLEGNWRCLRCDPPTRRGDCGNACHC